MASKELNSYMTELRKGGMDFGSSISEAREKMRSMSENMPLLPDTLFTPLTIKHIPCEMVEYTQQTAKVTILHFHGGGYVLGSCLDHRLLAAPLAKSCQARVLLPEYRLAPENPYPAALDDAVDCYQWLLDEGYDPSHIFIGGNSAGGGLAIATLYKLRENKLPLPAAAYAMSPWLDLTLSGESYQKNAAHDPIASKEGLGKFAGLYLHGHDATDSMVSPLFGDLRGLPPILLQTSTDEVLLDDSNQFAERAQKAGATVACSLWQEVPHSWQGMGLPESYAAMEELNLFLEQHYD